MKLFKDCLQIEKSTKQMGIIKNARKWTLEKNCQKKKSRKTMFVQSVKKICLIKTSPQHIASTCKDSTCHLNVCTVGENIYTSAKDFGFVKGLSTRVILCLAIDILEYSTCLTDQSVEDKL